MEETHEQHKLHGFMQCMIYVSIALEFCVFLYPAAPFWGVFAHALNKLSQIAIYQQLIYSKLYCVCLHHLVQPWVYDLLRNRRDDDQRVDGQYIQNDPLRPG